MGGVYDFRVLRTLRLRKNLTLENLSKLSGLSYPTIALIENNKSFPSLKTLDAIAAALNTQASTLLSLAERNLVKKGTAKLVDPLLMDASNIDIDSLRLIDFKGLRLLRLNFKIDETVNSLKFHDDRDCYELCYCLKGLLKIRIIDGVYQLKPNDVIIFDGSSEHEYTAIEKTECLIVHLPTDELFMENLIKRKNTLLSPKTNFV